MHVAAALISLTVWFGDAEPPPQVAVKEVFDAYQYQRSLLPRPDRTEPVEASGGTTSGGGPEGRPDGGGATAGGDPDEPPPGDEWSRADWERQLAREHRRLRELPRRLGDRQRRERMPPGGTPMDRGSGLRALFEILVFIAIGVAVLTIVSSLIRGWGRREATIKPKVAGGKKTPQAELDAPRTQAEALAAQGRYTEAVHVLLLKTIEALVATQPGGVPQAWTSREIQHQSPMPAAARGPFGVLVDSVEHGLFGGREVDEAGWADCLERFREFETAYRATGA